MTGVALRLRKSPLRSSANEKEKDFLSDDDDDILETNAILPSGEVITLIYLTIIKLRSYKYEFENIPLFILTNLSHFDLLFLIHEFAQLIVSIV